VQGRRRERAEYRAEDGDRGDRGDGADPRPPGRIRKAPEALVRMREPVAQASCEAARPPRDHRRAVPVPRLDQSRTRIADVEGLARSEDVVVGIAAARQPDAAGEDRHAAAAGAEGDDVTGRQRAHRLGLDRGQERGRRLLRIHHGRPCVDEAVIFVSTRGQIQ